LKRLTQRHFPLLPTVLATLIIAHISACETNDGTADVQIVDTEETNFEDTVSSLDNKSVVDGCDWAGGSWTMKTCRNGDGFNFTVQMSGCDADIASDDDYLKDAIGTIQDSGMTLSLQSGEICHAFWDGQYLVGACSFTAQDLPCWLLATPQ
jgi:hypothetical protein